MSLIDGIGGVLLFSNNPKRLATWYRDCLGIEAAGADAECNSVYTTFESWDINDLKLKRETAWAILPAEQNLEGQPRTAQINYRVPNMQKILTHLKSKGVTIEKTAEYPYGNFAWVKDPDGNQIELWEPSVSE
jgi:predicted enzyme related to lactoylglutathione lyase